MIAGVIHNSNINLDVIESEWGHEIANRARYAMVCQRVWTFLDVVTIGEREFWILVRTPRPETPEQKQFRRHS